MEWTPIVDCAYDATCVASADVANVVTVTIQLKDFAGNNLKVVSNIYAYVTSDSDGLTYAVEDFDTPFAETTGTLVELVSRGQWRLISDANGAIVLTIGDTGDNECYLVLVLPNGKIVVSNKIETTT